MQSAKNLRNPANIEVAVERKSKQKAKLAMMLYPSLAMTLYPSLALTHIY